MFLGSFYYHGEGVNKNTEKAREIFEELCYYGDRQQSLQFSMTLKFGFYSFPENLTLSQEFERTSANQPGSMISYFDY
jgi:TPR repeat protein